MRPSLARLLLVAPGLVLLLAACSGAAKPVAVTSGVAATEARTDGAVLWTRVDREATLTLEVAADGSFSQLALEQEVPANGGSDFTAQALASGLAPGAQHSYRFRHDDAVSPTGTFGTAAAVDDFNLVGDVRVDLAAPPVAVEAVAGPIGAETLGAAIARTQGQQAVPVYEQLFQQVARVFCTDFDAFSYGLVEVDPAAGTATIMLKDEDGTQLCRTVVTAGGA